MKGAQEWKMQRFGNVLGPELQRLKKECGQGYKEIAERFNAQGRPFYHKSVFSRILHDRQPIPRLNLLRLLVWVRNRQS
jgi:hypothetical protein